MSNQHAPKATWADNRAMIQGLWPSAAMTKELAALFEDRLSTLDQAMLATAIGNHRVESSFPSPDIGAILTAYHKAKRLHSSSWERREREAPLPPSPAVDVAVESKTCREIDVLVQDVEWSVEAVDSLIERILDAMDAGLIGPPATNRKLVPLYVLRSRLMGKVVHPVAMARAEIVWPDIAAYQPGGEAGEPADEMGDAWEPAETMGDVES